MCCISLCDDGVLTLPTGTATAMMWTLRVEGRLFHSGLPHKGINSLELAMETINYIQTQFYKDFPAVSLHTAGISLSLSLSHCLAC